ncbi:MAG: amidohydrolase family protein [Myxococcales bacterium]|nr:amidohydrolase family protein [Myxococcales bacterium]MCB9630213.1 amidohydrolase family protein [Sandaracinaceae bacterium]
MQYDLKLTGGTIIDGSGAPGYRGDVGIKDGVIVALGVADGDATRTLDATGRVVCPGFVDIHTHYDAQVMWDNKLTCSPWHGVTTAVVGNCGFGIAPMRPEHRDIIMRTLEKVEGMSYEALSAGLGEEWPFVTYPEYLDALEARGCAINLASVIGHSPLRLYVMGEDATEREASELELDQMQALVREAMQAGAIGFSTSMAPTHHGAGGKPVPSRLAAFSEVDALVGAMRESGRGVLQAAQGKRFFNKEFVELATRHGVPITWTALLAGMAGPGSHHRFLEVAAEHAAAGLTIVPQVACRPIMFDFHLGEPYPFEILPAFHGAMRADAAGKLAIYADAAFREQFKRESAKDAKNVDAGWPERAVISRYDADPSLEERPVVEVANERGVDPVDLVLDLSIASGLTARFRFAFLNHDQSEVRDLIQDPNTVITLSDAGAHADQLCDACYSTHLLGHWVREQGALTLERAVHALTQRPATLVGLLDRGLLALGRPADVVVFDPATVAPAPLRRLRDLPGGAERLVADAIGVDAVIVNGQLLRHRGEDQQGPEDALPGVLLRGGQAPGARGDAPRAKGAKAAGRPAGATVTSRTEPGPA